MPDFDANEDLTRLPDAGPGGLPDLADARLVILRYLDVVLVVLAAPVAIALGASPLGYLIAAGAWVLQRVLQQLDRRWIAGRGADARFGLNLVDGFGRIWLLAAAIVLAAVIGGRGAGLTAALVIFCVYSIAFAMRVVEGRPGGPRP